MSAMQPTRQVSAGQPHIRVARGGVASQGLLLLRGSEKGTPRQFIRKPTVGVISNPARLLAPAL